MGAFILGLECQVLDLAPKSCVCKQTTTANLQGFKLLVVPLTATAVCMHTNLVTIGDRTCSSKDMIADKHTHRQANRQTRSSQYSAPLSRVGGGRSKKNNKLVMMNDS